MNSDGTEKDNANGAHFDAFHSPLPHQVHIVAVSPLPGSPLKRKARGCAADSQHNLARLVSRRRRQLGTRRARIAHKLDVQGAGATAGFVGTPDAARGGPVGQIWNDEPGRLLSGEAEPRPCRVGRVRRPVGQ
jgi:hypothetical protein